MRPAHSVAGYTLATEQGADYIECDLAVTKDLKLVCLHDAFLTSVTNVKDMRRFHDRKVIHMDNIIIHILNIKLTEEAIWLKATFGFLTLNFNFKF